MSRLNALIGGIFVLTGILILEISIYAIQYEQQITGEIRCVRPNDGLTREGRRNDSNSKSREVVENGIEAKASWYGREACIANGTTYSDNCLTASGEVFNETAFTMACTNDFPLGSTFELCNIRGNGCVIARCNDRGNFARLGRTFDFSRNLFSQFADASRGVITVRYKIK